MGSRIGAQNRRRLYAGAAAAGLIGLLSAGGALAQTAGSTPFSGSALRIDPTQPIEIAANAFEVRPRDQVGVFEGAVEVIQGPITLKADVIEVFYYRPKGPDGTRQGQTVQKLNANGNVSITSPEDRAEGKWATYDVENRKIALGGGVLLTRGENIVEGSVLSIDLANNVSRLDPADPPETDDEGGTAQPPARVRAVFTPPPPDDDADE